MSENNFKDNFQWTERELKEISFCMEYADKYAHGTDGHNIRMLVAKMAGIISQLQLDLAVVNELFSNGSLKEGNNTDD